MQRMGMVMVRSVNSQAVLVGWRMAMMDDLSVMGWRGDVEWLQPLKYNYFKYRLLNPVA
jgi:hypothetical protein